jgi:eukaryotic-like serine/threonine-protein kinase
METVDQLNSILAGRYAIERELGAGGMATVYLAADLKHDRKVAIKVLKPELAAVLGAERFVVEIKTTASLSHPHILPLFDSGTVDGLPFYVMPYIAGETVRDKLNRETQFGVEEAVRIAREVADALDYAHRHGVIHRDIKPENVLLHDGRALVMDFGIALAVSAAAGGRMTETGLSLGTPHYMSPEQATAEKDITGRSDIYSLASVLYEMLAGQPPHVGGSAQQIIMKIIAEPVAPVVKFRKSVPPNVAAATAKALEKIPADRFETARAFGDALANPAFATTNLTGATLGVGRSSAGVSRLVFAATVGVAALAVAALVWAVRRPAAVQDATVVRVAVDLQPGERIYSGGGGSTLAISPRGDRVVYAAQLGTGLHLMIRRTGELSPRELVPVLAIQPTFSPDGRWVAYVENGQLKKVPADGGTSVVMTSLPVPLARGFCWKGLDSIVFGSDVGLFVVSSKGGTARRVTDVDSTEAVSWPVVLQDGETVAYTVGGSQTSRHIAVTSLASHRTTSLEILAAGVIGMREDYLLYVTSGGDLDAVPFDSKSQRVTGDPVQIESNIRFAGTGAPLAALSESGSLWFLSGQPMGYLERVTQNAAETRLLDEQRSFRTPRFSPDGRKIAVAVNEAKGTNIWVYDLAGRTFTPLANDATYPEWSPDSKRVLFRFVNQGKQGIWWQPADGSGKAELLYEPPDPVNEAILSPDGKWLVYRTAPGTHNRDIYAVPLDGDRKPILIVGGPAQESHMRLSPDGKWLAYQSNESGRFEIYVRPFPGNGARVGVSSDGGAEPTWSRTGSAIMYRTPSGGLESAAVKSGASLVVGERHLVLQPGDFQTDVTHAGYDQWPDGSGFLMVKPIGAENRPILVHNWGRVLREKLGR